MANKKTYYLGYDYKDKKGNIIPSRGVIILHENKIKFINDSIDSSFLSGDYDYNLVLNHPLLRTVEKYKIENSDITFYDILTYDSEEILDLIDIAKNILRVNNDSNTNI